MFAITGQVTNCFTIPKSEKYDEAFKVQLLGDLVTKDGQIRKEMVTLSIPAGVYSELSHQIGHDVTLPVGLFASSNGKLNVYYSDREKAA